MGQHFISPSEMTKWRQGFPRAKLTTENFGAWCYAMDNTELLMRAGWESMEDYVKSKENDVAEATPTGLATADSIGRLASQRRPDQSKIVAGGVEYLIR